MAKPSMRTKTSRFIACLLCTLGLPWAAAHETSLPPLKFDRAIDGWPLPDFSLVDQNGDELNRHRMLGQWSFVLFGDTNCASACADALTTLTAMRQRIAGTRVVQSTQFVFVSLDPTRDDATRLKTFLAPYDPELVAATGAAHMLKTFADELGATQRFDAAAGHGGSLVLVGPEGNVRAVYVPPYEVKRLTADYLLKRSRRR